MISEIKQEKYEKLTYYVNENGTLEALINDGPKKDVVIPRKMPKSGILITSIAAGCLTGEFGKITLPNSILRIAGQAFYGANIDEIVWPKNCLTIPKSCFKASNLTKIHNIDNVTEIQEGAFSSCVFMQEFKWPAKCEKIPRNCFATCGLKTINGIDSVTEIESHAFFCSRIETITWPSACTSIPDNCFCGSNLRKIDNIEKISNIGSSAFQNVSSLLEVDLSSSQVTHIDLWAFSGLSPEKVHLPYYMDEEDAIYLYN